MNIFQDHVLPNAKDDLSQSELFTNEDSIDAKDKEFMNLISNKSSKEITPKEHDRLKYIVRKNIPVSVRMKVWLLLSGGAEITYQSLYADTCKELFREDGFIPDGEEAEKRQFLTYYLTPEGGKKLRRVLCVTKHLNPDITYCPLLEPVVSILLHFFDEESTFSVVSGLLSGTFSAPFLDQTKMENISSDATLQDFFEKVNKKGFTRLNSFLELETPTTNKVVLFPSWRLCIFENLDFVSLTRLMDCLFAEGAKMLYRFGLYLLAAFYEYSLAFKKLHCSAPDDLVVTIGQFAESLTLSADELVKNATKINITTKQMFRFKQDNIALYKANKMDWLESNVTKQVVAIDLRQVSDIIQPHQWQVMSGWLPARIQIKQPFLLFTTNRDGYNLKTLYQYCEEEDQTLVIVQTSTNEIFGAYLSVPISKRYEGRKNMSFFGTGETFLFTLLPSPCGYHWNRSERAKSETDSRKISSHYVFVDTNPVNDDAVDGSAKPEAKKGRKGSMKRRLSKKGKEKETPISLHPLNVINIKRSSYSVPKHLYLGEKAIPPSVPATIPENRSSSDGSTNANNQGGNNRKLISAHSIDNSDLENHRKMSDVVATGDDDDCVDGNRERLLSTESGLQLRTPTIPEEDVANFDVIEESSAPPKIGSPVQVNNTRNTGSSDGKAVSLFISCDNIRMIVGGGVGEGLWMDGELAKGRSTRCETFNNEPLTSNEGGDFTITRVDVFGFQ